MKYIVGVLFILGVAASVRAGAVRTGTLVHVPSADILPSQKVQVQAGGSYFLPVDTAAGTMSPAFGGKIRLKIGLLERFEGGVEGAFHTGQTASFKPAFFLRGLICEERGWVLPNLAFGVENIFSAAEAGYNGIVSADTLERAVNTVYLAATKTIEPIKARLTLGLNSTASLTADRWGPFAAWEQYFGANMYLDLEFYRKLGLYQTAVSATWNSGRAGFSVGITNVQAYFRAADSTQRNLAGFRVPGVCVNLNFYFQAGNPRPSPLTLYQDSLSGLQSEVGLARDSLHQAIMARNYALAEVQKLKADTAARDTGEPAFDAKQAQAAVEQLLEQLAASRKNEIYDADSTAALMKKIVKYSEYSLPVLEKMIKNPNTTPAAAAQAISLVGQIGNKRSREMLADLLNRRESNLKIEALIALGKLRDRSVIQYITDAMQDTDTAVAETARMVLESLNGPADGTAAPAETSPNLPLTPGKTRNAKK